ncbi:thiamine phosphate synthase [Pseudenhygromyxa sp. WMMC2535]|uniref:thiamine phosphate synthase n=1 Tax=Pseudenhygromyxa sp. WMMC2535 TaxID=2712867 RepID=UPI001553F612|nr:thiamine phosphate synthase [Pseudenhygromyxa sp. WMMC2535]NVB38126.1 thiamine phosphate synthase [Pseudenhygromyxa sp. WMMC2535]
MSAPISGLYAILDWPQPHGLAPELAAAAMIRGGARILQLRAKHADTSERLDLLTRLAPVCAEARVPLIVNDDLDLALRLAPIQPPGTPPPPAASPAASVAGIHLGQTDLQRLTERGELSQLRARTRAAGLLLGLSTHDLAQVDAAIALVPDYLGFGPVFPTHSKQDPDPTVGLATLTQAVTRAAPLPLVAIGGIDLERVPAVVHTEVAAIAMISALVAPSPDEIEAQTRHIASAIAPEHPLNAEATNLANKPAPPPTPTPPD